MAQTPEGRVKAAVKKWLTARGIWYFMPANNGMGRSGIPDFICCWRGHFLAIETKAPGKLTYTTPNQDQRLLEITDHGGLALVVDDVSQLSRVETWMKLILQTTSLKPGEKSNSERSSNVDPRLGLTASVS